MNCPEGPPTNSHWREFQFAFHRILAAITPRIPLRSTLENWNRIAADLAEASRKRVPQVLVIR